MIDILSKSTQTLAREPAVREAIHKLLDMGDKQGQPLAVHVTIDGKQVEITRVPSVQSESKG